MITGPSEDDESREVSQFRECSATQCIKVQCPKTQIYVHYDSQSNRCILGMDHYCAFIGNVVAKGSYKYFFLFLFYIFVQCALGVILIMKYSITNNLQYHIPLSPIRTLIYKNTFMMRTLFAWIMIDPNKGDWNGWTRDYIGLNGLNYTTNEYIYPEESGANQ